MWEVTSNYDDSNYNLDKLIIRYNDHPSIVAIKNKCTELDSSFTFKKIDKEQIFTGIKRLDSEKVSKSNNISLRIIKEFSNIFGGFLAKNFNEYSGKGFLQDELKYTEVVLVYERTDEKDKKNYRPVIVFSNISKLNKRCIHNKLTNILNHFYQSFNVFQARIQYTTLPFSDGRENEKKLETTKEFLLRFSLTSPKLLTVYLTI